MFSAPSKTRWRVEILNMDVSKNSDHIKVNIKMSKPSQELPTSCKIPNFDLKDTDILFTYKINLERKFQNMGVIKTSYLDFRTKQDDKLFLENKSE